MLASGSNYQFVLRHSFFVASQEDSLATQKILSRACPAERIKVVALLLLSSSYKTNKKVSQVNVAYLDFDYISYLIV